MAMIPLTRDKVAIVDDEDYEKLSKFNWRAHKDYNVWYAIRHIWKGGKRTTIRMHREILNMPPGIETDHKDHNGLNNRRNNLRIATRRENAQNGRKSKGTTSKWKGVSWYKRYEKWRGAICVRGRDILLGYFNSEIEAARAYDIAAKKYFGDFACTNFNK